MRLSQHLVTAAAVAATVLLVFAAPSRADIIYNNLGPGDSFSASGRLVQGETFGTIGDVDQASSFVNGASDAAVTSVSLGINASNAGPLDILIADDAAGLPGAILRTLHVANVSGQGLVTANDGGSLVLLANTKYWIIADGKTTFDGGWNFNTTGATDPTAGRSDLGAWSLTGAANPTALALRLEARLVPEPASLAACALGSLPLLARRRRPN